MEADGRCQDGLGDRLAADGAPARAPGLAQNTASLFGLPQTRQRIGRRDWINPREIKDGMGLAEMGLSEVLFRAGGVFCEVPEGEMGVAGEDDVRLAAPGI